MFLGFNESDNLLIKVKYCELGSAYNVYEKTGIDFTELCLSLKLGLKMNMLEVKNWSFVCLYCLS